MLNETQQKIELYNKKEYILSNDSLTNETINLEFEAIDNHLYNRLKNIHLKHSDTPIISELKQNKIVLGSIR